MKYELAEKKGSTEPPNYGLVYISTIVDMLERKLSLMVFGAVENENIIATLFSQIEMTSVMSKRHVLTSRRTEERTDGGTDGQRDGRTDGRKDGSTDGRTDGSTDGQFDGRTDRRTDVDVIFIRKVALLNLASPVGRLL